MRINEPRSARNNFMLKKGGSFFVVGFFWWLGFGGGGGVGCFFCFSFFLFLNHESNILNSIWKDAKRTFFFKCTKSPKPYQANKPKPFLWKTPPPPPLNLLEQNLLSWWEELSEVCRSSRLLTWRPCPTGPSLRWSCVSSPLLLTAPEPVTCSRQKPHVVLLSASFAFSLLISNGYSQKQGASKPWFTETSTQRQRFVVLVFFKLCALSDFETSVMLSWHLCVQLRSRRKAALAEWFLWYRNIFYWKTCKLK